MGKVALLKAIHNSTEVNIHQDLEYYEVNNIEHMKAYVVFVLELTCLCFQVFQR